MRTTLLKVESLESRRLLTVTFEAGQAILDANPRSLASGDINSDGRIDLLTSDSEKVQWLENQLDADGNVAFAANTINAAFAAHSVDVADLDGDGDLDVLVAGGMGEPTFPENSWDVLWYENLDGNGTFAEPSQVGQSNWFWLGVLETADMDGDDDLDVLLGTGGGLGGGAVSWFENDGDGNFIDEHPIVSGESISHLDVQDLDGDGDQDLAVLFSTDFNWMLFAWYENAGNNTDFEQHEIHTEFSFPMGGGLMDVDSDGDLDAVYGAGGLDNETIAWNENLGEGTFGERNQIWDSSGENGFVSIQVLAPTDIDRDGDSDLFYHVNSELRLFNNQGDGTFESEVVGQNIRSIADVIDVNGDSDPDLVATTSDGLVWLENQEEKREGDLNQDGSVNFADFLILSSNFGRDDAGPEEGDLTGDGLISFEDFLRFAANFDTE